MPFGETETPGDALPLPKLWLSLSSTVAGIAIGCVAVAYTSAAGAPADGGGIDTYSRTGRNVRDSALLARLQTGSWSDSQCLHGAGIELLQSGFVCGLCAAEISCEAVCSG